MCLAGGCDPSAPVPFIELRSSSDPSIGRAYLLPDLENTGGAGAALGPVAQDVGEVRYSVRSDQRPFLFNGDLADGILGGAWLQLPRLPAGASLTSQVLADEKWGSFRVYDIGECSIFVAWEDQANVLTDGQGIGRILVEGITAGFVNNPRVTNGRRTGEATVLPILRSLPSGGPVLRVDDDRILVNLDLHADNVGGPIGTLSCDDVDVHLAVELGWRRLGGVLEYPPCSSSGGAVELDDPYTYDFEGVVVAVNVDVNTGDGCVLADAIESSLEDGIRSGLPGAFVTAIQDATLVAPSLLGIDVTEVTPCVCDTDCNIFGFDGPAYPGLRHRCRFEPDVGGQCYVQLEVDRLAATPEGMMIVLAENGLDPQRGLLRRSTLVNQLACEPTRRSVAPDAPPLQGDISVVTIPPPP